MRDRYDNGGPLNPGMHLVENKTGRPERIMSTAQYEALTGNSAADLPIADDIEDDDA